MIGGNHGDDDDEEGEEEEGKQPTVKPWCCIHGCHSCCQFLLQNNDLETLKTLALVFSQSQLH
jgi:hypothetical protein